MPYLLKKIEPDDQGKIIRDAALNDAYGSTLKIARENRVFANSWAIDKERNIYLLKAPSLMREDSQNRYYFFSFNGFFFRLFIKGWFGSEVYIENLPAEISGFLQTIQKEITEAFALYGEQGAGSLNEFGSPEFLIVPSFSTGE